MKVFTVEQVEKMLEKAVLQGFAQSCEGYNAEYPFGDHEQIPTLEDVVGEFYIHNMVRKELKKMDDKLLKELEKHAPEAE